MRSGSFGKMVNYITAAVHLTMEIGRYGYKEMVIKCGVLFHTINKLYRFINHIITIRNVLPPEALPWDLCCT